MCRVVVAVISQNYRKLSKRIYKVKKTFIIAEAGVNHNGDLATAKKMIDIAQESGADAVKFQTFFADKVVVEKTR